jgi:hypothetical protein
MSWETCADLENFKFPMRTVLTADIPRSVCCTVLALALALAYKVAAGRSRLMRTIEVKMVSVSGD